MKRVLVLLILSLVLSACGSTTLCTTKATNRGGGYYINR